MTEAILKTGPAHKWTADVNGWDTSPISISGCLSDEYFARETKHIFKKSWIAIGRVEELPTPGRYMVRNFDAPKCSVLVIRGKDNVVRAFHNVCSHRCNRIAWEARGSSPRLFCRYHGWLYDTAGRLIRVPDESEFYNLNKEELGLTPVALEIWNGFMFVNLDPAPPEGLKESMSELYSGLDDYPFDEMTHCVAWTARVGANWKLLKDAFCEIYHLPFAHRQSAAFGYSSAAAPVPHALAIRTFAWGGQYTFGRNLQAEYPPTTAFAASLSSVTLLADRARLMDPAGKPALFNPTNAPDWFGEVVQFYPCLQLSIYPSYYYLHNFIPVSADATLWELRRYTREPGTFAERFAHECAVAQLKATVLEDVQIVEQIHAAMSSGAKKYFQLSDQELLVRANHALTQKKAGPYSDQETIEYR